MSLPLLAFDFQPALLPRGVKAMRAPLPSHRKQLQFKFLHKRLMLRRKFLKLILGLIKSELI